MILTCPECATSYFVDASRIPPTGRRVRCSSCGHRWTMGPEGPIADQAEAPAEASAPEEPLAPEPIAAEDDLEVGGPEVIPVRPPLAPSLREKGARAEGRSLALLWAGMAAVAAAVIAGAIIFREDVVRLWPKSSAAYAGLGFPVNGGLIFEQVKVEPTFVGGRPVLSVTGAIRNVRDQAVTSPAIRVSLLDRNGKAVAAKIARPVDPNIPAHAKRHFAIGLLDPPASARDLEVRFETSDGKEVRAGAVVPAAAPAPATPAVEPPPVPTTPTPLTPAAMSEHG